MDKTRLLAESPKDDPGVFALGRMEYVYPGKNVPRVDRCDNYTIAGTIVAQNTPYEGECIVLGKKSDYSDTILLPQHVARVDYPLFCPPNFLITYIEISDKVKDVPHGMRYIEDEPTPSTMWIARSIYQLFKNIREWSFMTESPFNLDHPMAIYSKIVLETLSPPENILQEIDNMPDMHLAKFLKGQPNYRQIPDHPTISNNFKDWIIEITEMYPYKEFNSQII